MPDPPRTRALETLHRRLALATAVLLLPFLALFVTWTPVGGFRELHSPKTRMGFEVLPLWFLGETFALATLGAVILLIRCARAPRAGNPAAGRLRLFGLGASGLGLCAIALSDAGLVTETVAPTLWRKGPEVLREIGFPGGFALGLGLALVGAFTIPRRDLRGRW